ncbi:hypothetical protein [Rhizobium leguminosarum]|uniref:hypothetical protein n=1 Tax=Rhizobium leguminosarum TaxID=384 RepID=UPI00144213F5|nr:hypothetical protein [Rhizobium leguminosarum]NKL58327.1 hypothetical protein [Rhizobium leguminosarum bv. viciae]
MAYSAIFLPNNLAASVPRGENCGFDSETELVAANMRAHFLSFGDNFVGMSEKKPTRNCVRPDFVTRFAFQQTD